MTEVRKMIRAIFRTAEVPGLKSPHNVISTKIYYPAIYGDTPEERNTGDIPVDRSFGTMPVFIMTPGVNLDPAAYEWLARQLAENGIVTVLFKLISEIVPGVVNLTPGLDITAMRSGSDGSSPPGIAYRPILEMLKGENENGTLKNALDLESIWLGGHSAGGSTALASGSKEWFPEVQGIISYAAHTGMSTMLGYPKGYIKPVPDIPVVIIGGTQDGCIANSAHRYGDPEGDATGRVIKTFDDGVSREEGDCILAVIEGANHFTIAHPIDHSTGRSFIDMEETCDGAAARQLIGKMILGFVAGDQTALDNLLSDPILHLSRRK